MLDKIQKELGCPDRLSTVRFILLVPSFTIAYFHVISTNYNNLIPIIIMVFFILNCSLFLIYISHADKKK